MKTAFITGIAGQDGKYLSKSLLSDGYKVIGLSRNNNTSVLGATVITGDVSNESLVNGIIKDIKPHEVYNLAGVHRAYHHDNNEKIDQLSYAIKTNTIGPLNILRAISNFSKDSKFFQAGSSEVFDKSVEVCTTSTPVKVSSAYGCSKIMAQSIVQYYRECEGIFAVNGFLFNHESPERPPNFVTTKIIRTAVRISLGLDKKLKIGNLDSKRDWGHAKDYTDAMRLTLGYDEPRDWIIASGSKRSVRDLCKYVFSSLAMDYNEYIVENNDLKREDDIGHVGDVSYTKKELRWKTNYTFEQMLDEMIEYWTIVEKTNG